MPNIASVFKSEISRIVRKELRSEFQATKKAVSSYRSQIAQLKRQVKSLEQQLKKISREHSKTPAAPQADGDTSNIRFSAKGLTAQRKRLGLSVVATAKLLGVSAQSVANWESGTTRPRQSQLEAIAALRKMGKREVVERLSGQ
jgi:DNA-binding transcriptional regulator YiaG